MPGGPGPGRRGREDAADPVGVQLGDLVGDDDAASPAEDLHVAGAPLAQQVVEVLEVLDVAALVRADGDALHVLLHGGRDDLVDRAIVTQVDDLGALALEDPPHDVDRGVVPVEQAGGGDEPHRVDRSVQVGRAHGSRLLGRPTTCRGAPSRTEVLCRWSGVVDAELDAEARLVAAPVAMRPVGLIVLLVLLLCGGVLLLGGWRGAFPRTTTTLVIGPAPDGRTEISVLGGPEPGRYHLSGLDEPASPGDRITVRLRADAAASRPRPTTEAARVARSAPSCPAPPSPPLPSGRRREHRSGAPITTVRAPRPRRRRHRAGHVRPTRPGLDEVRLPARPRAAGDRRRPRPRSRRAVVARPRLRPDRAVHGVGRPRPRFTDRTHRRGRRPGRHPGHPPHPTDRPPRSGSRGDRGGRRRPRLADGQETGRPVPTGRGRPGRGGYRRR